MITKSVVKNGMAASALLAGGIGAFIMGLMTTLSEAIPAFGSALNWYKPAGPLSGKTTVTVVLWLIVWGALARMWKDEDVNFERISRISFVLLILGILGTFPPFFELFASE